MINSIPDTSATSAAIATTVSGILGAAAASSVTRLVTADRVASPRMVPAKFELDMSNTPPATPWPAGSAAARVSPERFDSPVPCATPRISPVPICTMRASIATVALDDFLPRPPSPIPPRLNFPPPTPSFLSSRPNWVTDPMMMASTPSSRPSFAAVEASARPSCWKFCSFRTRSTCVRSITE